MRSQGISVILEKRAVDRPEDARNGGCLRVTLEPGEEVLARRPRPRPEIGDDQGRDFPLEDLRSILHPQAPNAAGAFLVQEIVEHSDDGRVIVDDQDEWT